LDNATLFRKSVTIISDMFLPTDLHMIGFLPVT